MIFPFEEDHMSTRVICNALAEMRAAYESRNFSYLLGLIEEAQSMANRMETALIARESAEYYEDEIREYKKQIRELKREKRALEDEVEYLRDELFGLKNAKIVVHNENAEEEVLKIVQEATKS
jgi:uncharacterized coiled-coil DUF342 family protein